MVGKIELADAVAEKCSITKAKAKEVVTALFDVITETVASGDSVSLVGFGTFSLHERKARKGINPATKAKIDIPASKAPAFKAGKAFKDVVNK